MNRRELRFGVRAISGRCAATWKVWNEGSKSNDVYVACRALGGELKASLHQSGQWHISFTRTFFTTKFPGSPENPRTRFPDSWHRPKELSPGFTLAHRIVVPWYAATSRPRVEAEEVIWVPPAPADHANEFAVIFTSRECPEGEWPGSRSMKSGLVGSFQIPSGERVWVVWTVQPVKGPPSVTGVPSFFVGKGHNDLRSRNLRAVAFAHEPDGTRSMYDLPVQVRPTKERGQGDA